MIQKLRITKEGHAYKMGVCIPLSFGAQVEFSTSMKFSLKDKRIRTPHTSKLSFFQIAFTAFLEEELEGKGAPNLSKLTHKMCRVIAFGNTRTEGKILLEATCEKGIRQAYDEIREKYTELCQNPGTKDWDKCAILEELIRQLPDLHKLLKL